MIQSFEQGWVFPVQNLFFPVYGQKLTGQKLTGHKLTGQKLTGQKLTPLLKKRTKAHPEIFYCYLLIYFNAYYVWIFIYTIT